MEDRIQLTEDRLFESFLEVCRMSHLPKHQLRPVAFVDLPRMSLLYLCISNRGIERQILPLIVKLWELFSKFSNFKTYTLIF